MSNSERAADAIVDSMVPDIWKKLTSPHKLASVSYSIFAIIQRNIPLADAEFIIDDHGGHIKFQGKVWRP